MRFKLLYISCLLDFSNVFFHNRLSLQHRVKHTLCISHELTDFTANVLLNVRLAIVGITAEEFEITLQFDYLLSQPVTFHKSVGWGQLSCRNQIWLEDLQVFSETFDNGVGLLSLDLILDPHSWNLLLLGLLVSFMLVVVGICEFVLVEFVFISQPLDQFAFFNWQSRNVLVFLYDQVRDELILLRDHVTEDIVFLRDENIYLFISLSHQIRYGFVLLADECIEYPVLFYLQPFNCLLFLLEHAWNDSIFLWN